MVLPFGKLNQLQQLINPFVESIFLQELRAINDYYRLGYNIYYWRTAGGLEVDFILYGKRGIKAFEIKRRGSVSSGMLAGLKAFLKDYPSAKAFFIYSGKKNLYMDDIKVIPIESAIRNLADHL